MENLLKKNCKHCTEIFETTRGNKLYCSYSCKGRHAQIIKNEARPKLTNYVQYNAKNNVTPLAGDCVRLTQDYGRIKANTLGIIVGTIADKTDEYTIVFNPILPPYIKLNKELNCEGGTRITIKKDCLLHAGKTNMAYSYPDRKKADDLFLVNEFKTIL